MKYIILLKANGKAERAEEMEASERKVDRGKSVDQSELEVGHVIVIPNTETKVHVTAIGKDGITAQDDEGNKFLIRHENVKTEEEADAEDDDEKEEEAEQREKIKISLDDLLNKKEHKKGEKRDSRDKEKKKIDESTVEGYLKKNIKKDGWVQTSAIAKLMDIKVEEAEKQLKNLEERGILQLIVDSNSNGDVLYKYVNSERAETEAKPSSYSKDPFDRLKKKPKRKENEEELPDADVKKIKPSDIWKEDIKEKREKKSRR